MFNLDRLQALVAVHEHGSLRAAAQVLHVTPSALSQQIAKLQQEIGSQLTAPMGRGVRLTMTGLLLAERAKAILDLAASAEADLAALDSEVVGIVRVGSFASAGRAIVPRALSELKAIHPRLEVRFTTEETIALLSAVHTGTLDIAIIDSWHGSQIMIPSGVTASVLFRDVADVALPNDHPLAARQRVSLDQLGDVAWVVWRPEPSFSEWFIRPLRELGIEPNIQYDAPDFATQLELVAAGLGAAVVPRLATSWVSDSVTMVEVEPVLRRDIMAVSRRDNDRPALRAVLEALQRSCGVHSALAQRRS